MYSNMKKFITILFIIIFSQLICGYCYSKRCDKCLESAKKDKHAYPSIGVAWRDFGTPIVHKDGKAYATYKCCYGHVYLVCLDD